MYKAHWKDHEDCPKIINKGWDCKEENKNAEENVIKRMKACKTELKVWHKQTFKRADQEINKLKHQLQKIQNVANGEFDIEEGCRIKRKITKLWQQEEKIWGQRSQLKWLQWGNKNTSFFHAAIVQKRDRNRLQRLKNDQGEWVKG